MTDEHEDEQVKKQRQRSPNFPVVDLEKAIERTLELYEHDKKALVPISVIHDRWGYKKMSGILQQTVAALRAFGLIEVSGAGKKRQIQISNDGWKIVTGHSSREQLIKKAALLPRVFGHLWEIYAEQGGIPRDDVVREYLIHDYDPPFNEDSVDTFIDRFRGTIEFAKLTKSDIISGEENPKGSQTIDSFQGFTDAFFGPIGNSQKVQENQKAKMVITNVYDLPNAKLSIQLEQLDTEVPLNDEDVETAEIYWSAFKSVVEARLKRAKK